MKALINFLKSETVFCVSFFLALASALIVRPDSFYLAYPDYRTLALLFCLMLIVAGFRSLGVFDFMGRSLLKRAGSLRRLSVTMVLLCFWSSMVITNDVTLITFVPFTILVFRMVGEEERILKKHGDADREPAEFVSVFGVFYGYGRVRMGGPPLRGNFSCAPSFYSLERAG